MDILQHAIAWARGEVFEATLTATGGAIAIVLGLLAWRLGSTPAARSLVLPLLVLGGVMLASGLSAITSNQQRIVAMTSAFDHDPIAFIAAEKARVEGFHSLYTGTLVMASVAFASAAAIFWITLSPTWRGIAIGLVLLGLSGLVIDFFSKERADTYYEALTQTQVPATT